MSLILASSSPRRSQILSQLGIEFRIEAPDCDENIACASEDLPQELAKEKALNVSKKFPNDFILGYDTLVFCENEILGKPSGKENAIQMLKSLKNRKHEVITGISLVKESKILFLKKEITKVFFRNYSDLEILNYVEFMEYKDKAGAYAVQGRGARFVKSIDGCFYNVVGLPVALTLEALNCIKLENICH